MKEFTKKSLLFISIFFVSIYILQSSIFLVIEQIDVGEYGILNRIDKGKINADIIISGTSRSLRGVNPKIIEQETGLSCYNISSDGTDIGLQLPKLKWYLSNNNKPKIIVQDVNQFSGGVSDIIYEPYKYLPYLDNDSLYKGLKKNDYNFWMNKYLPPVNLLYYNFDFYTKLIKDLYNTLNEKDIYYNGFFADNSTWNDKIAFLNVRDTIQCKIFDSYKGYVHDLINVCKEADIKLLFSFMPVYLSSNTTVIDQDLISDYYETLAQKENIYFQNFNKIEEMKNKQYFYNYSHLNYNGANHFSLIISAIILSIKNNK